MKPDKKEEKTEQGSCRRSVNDDEPLHNAHR